MPLITWDDSFSINDIEIDNQHKKWISIANKLDDALMQRKELNEVTEKTLEAMIAYTHFHFSYEEAHMEKLKFPGLSGHQNVHFKFMKKIEQFQRDHQAGGIVLCSAIMKEITNWFLNHILIEDQQFKNYTND